ncbi:XRE family transcriptional regulator [Afifella pfennigii]|uniref:XRE family transcriptional regulator n=1 Tax=Afifella pfennigii TaxID=209897 RepID=UPI0009FCE880|nr:helix-turn-helix transcriptional regulator [Afifella pfennigii]
MMIAQDLSGRLAAERKRLALSQREMAAAVGVSKTSWENYEAGKSSPGARVLASLAELGADLHWLLTGAALRDGENESQRLSKTPEVRAEGFALIPKIDVQAAAGAGAVVDSEAVSAEIALSPRWLRARHINPAGARMLTAKGDSMEPTIRSGDTLIVDTSIEMVVDSGIYVVVYGGLLLVKRVQLRRDGSVILKSDNPAAHYEDEIVPAAEAHELRIAGRVMWFGREI